ncbi:MAG: alanine--tRNA ligase [Herpetosiphonaceae bacterium]|nr:alanine--tRNA ligase [Herpetosiphonaceae bacterium]
MKSAELRQRFLQFFARNDHEIVPSSSLVPANDPTLLFVNSGMVQFKDTFLGLEKRPYTMATTMQKCMRVGGKHNDLEDVGASPRHQTFFEMAGNFSFGEYFKRDAIRFAWDFLTEELQLPVERLWFSIYKDDDEAEQLWREVGARPERILRFGEKDNFWAMGDTGPCGPSSEIHYYQGDDPAHQVPEGVNHDDDYMEIWNLVFMQYERDHEGKLTPLAKPSIDTGMGLDRVTAVLQGVTNNYETDLFVPIIHKVIELAQTDEAAYRANPVPYRIVADHARACTFLIADGVRPGTNGRNYVLRRILRRAAYQGQVLHIGKPFLADTAEVVIEIMGAAYPELVLKRDYIKAMITEEEERFGRTLQSGVRQLDELIEGMTAAQTTVLAGTDAFRLYDTFGFPLDLTAKILTDRGLNVDEAGYEAERAAQRARDQKGSKSSFGRDPDFWSKQNTPRTIFTGYHELETFGHVKAIAVDGELVPLAEQGDAIQIVLDQSCFYGESGGQVGDTGVITGPQGSVRVTDVQKPVPGVYVHSGIVERGTLATDETVQCRVDHARRRDIMRNHTATHLLHRALRDVLGEHAEQRGSLVSPERLRFDFAHRQAVTPDELRQIESKVNEWIRADSLVSPAEMSQASARALGAMALFGEKYGDIVRVITVGCDDVPPTSNVEESGAHPDPESTVCSRELCGGTHVARTGEIGTLHITGESSIGSGLRRIEAVTGRGVEQLLDTQTQTLWELATKLGANPNNVGERIDALVAQVKSLQAQLAQAQRAESSNQLQEILAGQHKVGDRAVIAARLDVPNSDKLRDAGDWLRDKVGSGVVVLGTVLNEKPQLLVMVTPDLVKQGVHAGNLVKSLAGLVGGGGGGRPETAMAGGRDATKLDTALKAVDALLN